MRPPVPSNILFFLLPAFAFFFVLNLTAGLQLTADTDQVVAAPGLTLTAVGDLVMHMPVVNSAFLPEEESYDFRPVFAPLQSFLEAADLTVGVLETTLTAEDDKLSGYPRFNTPYQLAEALRWAGFDLVFTAHNHSLDHGFDGIGQTLDHLAAAGLAATGTRKNRNDKPYHIVNVNGIKLAFLSYTTITNGLSAPPDRRWALNTLDFAQIGAQIRELKAAGVDGIIMALHYGAEYVRYPSAADQKLCRRLCALGVDVLLGSHPHVIRPLEKVVTIDPFTNQPKTCLIAYSLGNFLSNQRWRYSDCGLMLTLHVRKKLWPPGLEMELLACSPLWVNRDRWGYRIMVVQPPERTETGTISPFSPQLPEKFREVWADTEEILTGWPGGIKRMQYPFFELP
mgnify:CR=1 FL=1